MAVENILATQATIGLLSSGFLQLLKKSQWVPKINENSMGLNHIVMLVTSAASALGISFTWSAAEHSLVITGLNIASIAAGLWLWAKQYTIQYLVHRGAFGAVSVPTPKP